MRMPTFQRFQKFMQLTAFFVCGMIVGSAIYSALKINIVDEVISRNFKLQAQLESIKQDLEKAQEVRKKNVIRSIVIIFEKPQNKPDIDILTQTALKKELKEDLSVLLGRSIYDINLDSQLARKLLANKSYDQIANKKYIISVKTMLVVDGVLQIWVEATEHLHK
ncbi:hypothetical protein [Cohnella abietis]|uniref:Sporulation membrane protein YtrI C-terminal domain-containing protein n=1 Tax=Cohnella abietis TaxID=2507935 RepID=A0A3T1DAE1_9BACL|nr:hypothetical protein [Cohnella abietis]BBI34994.1 hypothetical protein KCTCHS21_43930 [Cohnella abietis]